MLHALNHLVNAYVTRGLHGGLGPFESGIPLRNNLFCFSGIVGIPNHQTPQTRKKGHAKQQRPTVDGRNPANQLRLVGYPIILQGFSTIPGGCLGYLPSTVSLPGSSKWTGLISQKTSQKGHEQNTPKGDLEEPGTKTGCVCGYPYKNGEGGNLAQCFQSECGSFSKWIRLWSLHGLLGPHFLGWWMMWTIPNGSMITRIWDFSMLGTSSKNILPNGGDF